MIFSRYISGKCKLIFSDRKQIIHCLSKKVGDSQRERR